jgi:hypothetical protein
VCSATSVAQQICLSVVSDLPECAETDENILNIYIVNDDTRVYGYDP